MPRVVYLVSMLPLSVMVLVLAVVVNLIQCGFVLCGKVTTGMLGRWLPRVEMTWVAGVMVNVLKLRLCRSLV